MTSSTIEDHINLTNLSIKATNIEKKLAQLCDIEGIDPDDMEQLEEYMEDSPNPGICRHSKCDYTTEVEPDCATGYCESCNSPTVISLSLLLGII